MGVRTEECVIGGFTYRVRQHGYKEGRALLPIIMRAVGPTIGTLLEGVDIMGGKVDLEANLDLSRAMAEFSTSLSERDLAHISDKMAERSWILDGAKHQMACDDSGNAYLPNVEEEHWPERYGDWLQWMAFALKVNFASFLGGAGSGSVKDVLSAIVKGASASQSPSTSTGDSGGSSAAPG